MTPSILVVEDEAPMRRVIKSALGPANVDITTGFIGIQPPSYPINTIYLFTSGQHEAVLRLALRPSAPDGRTTDPRPGCLNCAMPSQKKSAALGAFGSSPKKSSWCLAESRSSFFPSFPW